MLSIPWFFAKNGQLNKFIWFYIGINVVGLFWVPYSGILIDKYSRKNIFLSINLISGLILGAVCFWGFQVGQLPLYAVAGIFIMTFLNYSIHYPCLYAFVQEITTKEKYGFITSILEVQGQATNIISGAIAVLLLEGTTAEGVVNILGFKLNVGRYFEAWEIHEIFTIDCLTYFVAFLIILSIRYVSLKERKEENTSLINRLRIGFNFLKENKTTTVFGIVSYMLFVGVMLEAFYLGAAYVSNHLNAAGGVYASSDIMYALGAFISGFAIRKIFKGKSIPFSIIILFCVACLLFFVLYITRSNNMFFLMLFFMGLTNAGSRILRVMYLFKNVPNQVFGRAASIFNICNIMMRIILLLIFTLPFFQADNHVIYGFLILSILMLISTIILIVNYKRFDLSKI